MFDIGWSEIVVVAVVAILVVGPKDLPAMLRTFGKTVSSFRRMAADFQRQFDQALRETELDSIQKEIKKPFQPLEDARKAAQDFQKQVNNSIGDASKDPPSTTATAEKPAAGTAVTDGAATGDPAAEGSATPVSESAEKPALPAAEATPAPAVANEAPAGAPEKSAGEPASATPPDEAEKQKSSSGTPA